MGKNIETLHRGAPMDENSVSPPPPPPRGAFLSASWVFFHYRAYFTSACHGSSIERSSMEGLRKLCVYPKPGGMKLQCIVVENMDYVIP